MPNVTINGLPWAEYAKQTEGSWYTDTAMEPFDEALAARVTQLAKDVDETTERVVDERKNVPASYARAVQRRADALAALAAAREEQRQRRLRKSRHAARFTHLARGTPLRRTCLKAHAVDADARARAETALGSVYAQLRHLHKVRARPHPGPASAAASRA